MKEGFEQIFSDIQTDMVSICLEYVEKRQTKYIYMHHMKQRQFRATFFYSVMVKYTKKANCLRGMMLMWIGKCHV